VPDKLTPKRTNFLGVTKKMEAEQARRALEEFRRLPQAVTCGTPDCVCRKIHESKGQGEKNSILHFVLALTKNVRNIRIPSPCPVVNEWLEKMKTAGVIYLHTDGKYSEYPHLREVSCHLKAGKIVTIPGLHNKMSISADCIKDVMKLMVRMGLVEMCTIVSSSDVELVRADDGGFNVKMKNAHATGFILIDEVIQPKE